MNSYLFKCFIIRNDLFIRTQRFLNEKFIKGIHISGQVQVPSMTTIQTLRNNKFDKRGVNIKQKHPVQIDWVSKEDGSHLMTVTIGSKVSMSNFLYRFFRQSKK